MSILLWRYTVFDMARFSFVCSSHVLKYIYSANLILITRLLRTERLPSSFHALQKLSKFDMGNTLPVLQQEFCSLWNELVEKVQNTAYLGSFSG